MVVYTGEDEIFAAIAIEPAALGFAKHWTNKPRVAGSSKGRQQVRPVAQNFHFARCGHTQSILIIHHVLTGINSKIPKVESIQPK